MPQAPLQQRSSDPALKVSRHACESSQMKQGRQSVQAFRKAGMKLQSNTREQTAEEQHKEAAQEGLEEQQQDRQERGCPAEAASQPGKVAVRGSRPPICKLQGWQRGAGLAESAPAGEAQAPPPSHHNASEECLPIPVVIVIQVFVIVVTVLVLQADKHTQQGATSDAQRSACFQPEAQRAGTAELAGSRAVGS